MRRPRSPRQQPSRGNRGLTRLVGRRPAIGSGHQLPSPLGSARFQAARLLSSAVDVSPILNPMDYNDLFVLEDLVDDPVVATTSRSQAFELAKQWFTKPSWILGNGSEYSSESCLSDLDRQLIEVSEPFRCDFDLIHRGFSDDVSKGKSLSSRRFLT
jgi:hypothetical protein